MNGSKYREHREKARMEQRRESLRLAEEQAQRNADADAAHEAAVAEMEARQKSRTPAPENKAITLGAANKSGVTVTDRREAPAPAKSPRKRSPRKRTR